jgi:hypothetical protein
MIDAQLLTELVQSCRLLACHQKNPIVLDMLHDLEEDFVQKVRDIESGKRYAGGKLPLRSDCESIRTSSAI